MMNIPSKKQSISLFEAFLPIIILIFLLSYNVFFAFKDDALSGSNQFILLVGAAVCVVIGWRRKVSMHTISEAIYNNIKATSGAILILFMVGALSGTWLISGIIPIMVFYGLEILNPTFFLITSVVVCALVSICIGSSWTTSATIGIALMGIGSTLGIPEGMIGGAIISGGYFGDKISPMSETTSLSATIAGTDVFTHIRYMLLTTIPSVVITLIIFFFLGFFIEPQAITDISVIQNAIKEQFNITAWVFIVPIVVLFLIYKKVDPLVALFIGVLLSIATAVIFQNDLIQRLTSKNAPNFTDYYKVLMNFVTTKSEIPTSNPILSELFSSSGMSGMLNTIWIIICAMTFGGAMEAIGALQKITSFLLNAFNSIFGLFASAVSSCLLVNITTSDQYLSLVIPGKMFSKAFQQKGLAPENLSRTLEDSGTVTSVLVPWNTCAAYNSSVLQIDPIAYIPYTFFNIISPIMTLIFAFFQIKIKKWKNNN